MPAMLVNNQIVLDGRKYRVCVSRLVEQPPTAPRLIVVAYQPNPQSQAVLRVCIQAIQKFTTSPYELWIVDNNSPANNADWLLEWPNINVVLSKTNPIPPEKRSFWSRFRRVKQQTWGSYANAIGLEIGAKLIDPNSQYLMTLHMDTMPCRPNWLSYLQSKIQNQIKAAGVRLEKARTPEGVLHVLGYMVDFQLFKQLQLDFFPRLPQQDVGDYVTVRLREAGYDVFACPNTLWQPELIDTIPTELPVHHLPVDRSFDDAGNVIFLHLGRGVRKSSGEFVKGASVEDWVQFAEEHLLV